MKGFHIFFGALIVVLMIILINSQDDEATQTNASATSITAPATPEQTATTSTTAASEDDFEQAANAKAESSKQPLKINIAALEEALKTVRRDQPGAWLEAFEERANQIYEGDEVISVEAKNHNKRLQITGYIKKGSGEGRSNNDEVIFVIEQNGEVTEGNAPARITTYTSGGNPVYHHSTFAETMLQYWILHQIFASPSYRYDTPASRLNDIRSSRNNYRSTPTYVIQRQNNTSFSSRWNNHVTVPRTSVPSVNPGAATQSQRPVVTAPVKTDSAPAAKAPVAAPAAPTARSTPAYTSPPAAAPAPVRSAPVYSAPAPTYRSTPSYSAPSSSGRR
ncbi:MAG: hypothetical protein IPP57_24330 [Candidatus Obscuribacter sp.]|jgi:hypothetical protein|nr:hypothetical protein [Candidatus Obscuribacter sp.]MBK7839852.1 hypothetical protein [Candidatus Obscuribacter sp.]MBK9773905.1 hypothetical protein [Candidatus Obscuribacter sp.]MDQ5966071.1 hypothetical protein [Cyanobacteriota bacterium erpe_2018_sw_39hr_WHONDRS-SW48-000098_B_bin.30]